MSRGILLALLIAMVVVGIYSVKEWMPIMAVAGNSMEPELKRGDAILIRRAPPSDIKVGDIIVFKVPPLTRVNYRYPSMVAHRVIEIIPFQGGLAFRTRGDNTTEDPFAVPAYDLRGEVKGRVPYFGHVLLYLQSRQGMVFATVALILLALNLYAPELSRGRQLLQRAVFGPLIEQNRELAQRQEHTSEMVIRALEEFAGAMGEYAEHLRSHTQAVKELVGASRELREAVREMKGAPGQRRGLVRPEGRRSGADQPIPGCYRETHCITSSRYQAPPGCYKGVKLDGPREEGGTHRWPAPPHDVYDSGGRDNPDA